MSKYSQKELDLIKAMGYSDIVELTQPITLYRMMAMKAFQTNLQGPLADSIRRCLDAYELETPYRNTKEWDDLIQLEKQSEFLSADALDFLEDNWMHIGSTFDTLDYDLDVVETICLRELMDKGYVREINMSLWERIK